LTKPAFTKIRKNASAVKSQILTARTKEFVLNRGATLVGVASARSLRGAPKGHRPADFLPEARSIVSLGLKINRAAILHLPKTVREYKIDYDVTNQKLNNIARETAHFLIEQGHEALAIPASPPYDETKNFGDISHKHAAAAAGLGNFGLNNLILTPGYGPYIRFVTILTTAKLKPDKQLPKSVCLGTKCMRCVEACPSGAIRSPKQDAMKGWCIDKEKCQEYLTAFSGGSVCGLCIKACPVTGHLGQV